MRERVERFYLSLAASDLTKAELREVALRIEKDGPDAFVRAITQLRDMAHALPMVGEFPGVANVRVGPHRVPAPRSDRVDDVTLHAVHTLRDELKLSVERAAEMLRSVIEKRGRENFENYMPRHREGFTRWINRVRRVVPDNLLLHEIARVRNNILHINQDWPLRDRED